MLCNLDFFQKDYLVECLLLYVQICRLSSIFGIYVHKYVYFNVIISNCLGRLTPSKHRLNGLNPKQRVTDCLPFRITLLRSHSGTVDENVRRASEMIILDSRN